MARTHQEHSEALWNKLSQKFASKDDVLNSTLVKQGWKLVESVVGNNTITLPSIDTVTEIYIEMYDTDGTIVHHTDLRKESLQFESTNISTREIVLDNMHDTQTYVTYSLENNTIIPSCYEGIVLDGESTNVTTVVYIKELLEMAVTDLQANNIQYDGSMSGINSNDVQGAIDELKGTISYTSKNLVPYPYSDTTKTYRDITYTDNNDGTITTSGTTTTLASSFAIRQSSGDALKLKKGTYILNGCPKEANDNCYLYLLKYVNETVISIAKEFGDGTTFTLEEDTELGLAIMIAPNTNVDNLVFKPMIRYASIQDDTFEQYIEDVDTRINNAQSDIDLLKGTVGYSKKQLFENKAVTRTLYGVTHTHNSDGTIISNGTNTSTSMSIITLTGTADNEYVQIDNLKDGEKYILNGCPSGGGEEIYSIRLIAYDPNDNNKWVKNHIDYGEGVEFTYNASLVYRFYISVSGGVTVTNLTFKPMIRYASIQDDTFEQYIEDVDTRLDNVENTVTDTVLPRYKKIKLSSSGWYRIAKMECRSESEANGGGNNSCDIEIKRMYNTISPEYKNIKLISLYKNSSFVDEISKSATDNANTITKIRHTVDTTNNTSYIEVYYNANSENNMFITLNNHFNVFVLAWKLIGAEATSETVDGVNVLGSHEFSLNTSSFSTYENLLYTPTVNLSTSTQVVRQVTVKRKGLLSTSFEIMANSIGIDYLSISVNDIEFARVCSPNNSASISMSMVVNAGDVVKYNAKGVGTGTNNGRIGGYIIYFN